MKLTVCLSASMFVLLALPGGVRADAPSNENNDDEVFGPVTLKPSQGTQTTEENKFEDKQESDEANSRNWLLVGFEQQVSKSEGHSSERDIDPDLDEDKQQSSDIYMRVIENKDLARLAGLPSIDPTATVDAPAFHAAPTAADPSAKDSMSLRPDGTNQTPDSAKPLFSALASPSAQASQPYFLTTFATPMSSILAPTAPILPTQGQPTPGTAPAASTRPSPVDTIDMETPGMTASKNDPLTGPPDLMLDSLPDQNQTDPNAAQVNDAPPQLQQAMDVDQMHLDQTTQLSVAPPSNVPRSLAGTQEKQAPSSLQSLQQPQTIQSAATPISQQPMLSPVRPPLPGPADFLNR